MSDEPELDLRLLLSGNPELDDAHQGNPGRGLVCGIALSALFWAFVVWWFLG